MITVRQRMPINLINNTFSCEISDILDEILAGDFIVYLYIQFNDTTLCIMLLCTDIIECSKFYFPLL